MTTGLRKTDRPLLPRAGFVAAAGARQDFAFAARTRGLVLAVLGLTIYGSLYRFNLSSAEAQTLKDGAT